MTWFKKTKEGYVDLGEKLRKQEERLENFQSNNYQEDANHSVSEVPEVAPEPEVQSGGFMGFFGGNTTTKTEEVEESPSEERRKKLQTVLRDLTNKLEEQESEIYRLKQRLEVIERKQNVGYR